MRAVVQRVAEASVNTDGAATARIGAGFCVLLGVEDGDGEEDLDWLVGKVARLRVFEDEGGRMTRDLATAGGEALVVSQFTLLASCRKGNRPSFVRAAEPALAEGLYQRFAAELSRRCGLPVRTGTFAAQMRVALVNDGPVTLVLDSRLRE